MILLDSRKRVAIAPQVSAGQTIFGDRWGMQRGVVGALVTQTSGGTLFGVSAGQVLSGSEVRSVDSPLVLGRRAPMKQPDATRSIRPPVTEAMGIFEIQWNTQVVGGALARGASGQVVAPIDVLGQRVRKLTVKQSDCWGLLTGVECALNLENSLAQTITTYVGAAEISSARSGDSFAEIGDAGMPVTTDAGDLVGFVLGRSEKNTFIAPACSLFAAIRMRIANTEDILAHNTNAVRVHGDASLVAASDEIDKRWPEIAVFGKALMSHW